MQNLVEKLKAIHERREHKRLRVIAAHRERMRRRKLKLRKRRELSAKDKVLLRRVWYGMMYRCHKAEPGSHAWLYYRGRGIKVYKLWHDYTNFERYATRYYISGLTIDRINNDGDYRPGNIRWATYKMQNQNKQKQSNMRMNEIAKELLVLLDQPNESISKDLP